MGPTGATAVETNDSLLVARVRIGLWVMLAANLAFAVADLLFRPEALLRLYLLKAVQIGAALLVFLLLRVPPRRSGIVMLTLFAICVTVGVSAFSGVLTQDADTTGVLCPVLALAAGTLLPWGTLPQAIAVAAAAVAILTTRILVDVPLDYTAVAEFVTLAASLYVAHELQRQRTGALAQIAARRASEDALRATERRFQVLVQQVSDVVSVVDALGVIQYISPSVERLFGYRPEEMIGREARLFVHPDDFNRLYVEFAASPRQPGAVPRAEFRHRHASGGWVYVEVTGNILSDDPAVRGTVLTLRDISTRKQAEEEIRLLNENLTDHAQALEESNRELEAFTYSVSHDLRAPLRAIEGFSRVLLEDYGRSLETDARRLLERVVANSERMGQLIADLLMLFHVTRDELHRQPVDLSGLAHAVADALRDANPHRAVNLVIADDIVADGDPLLLRIVLENLLGNAWKYTATHTPARIELGIREENGTPVYYVADNGVGFDMQYIDKLFTPFQRLHAAGTFEGHGVGLAIVERIIHRHGGRIWAEGVPEQGATFWFTLQPRARRPPAAPGDLAERAPH